MKSFDSLPTPEENNEVKISENEIQDFERSFCPYKYLDIKFALQHFLNYEIEDDLYAIINDFSNDTETKLENIDPCYVAYDHVLQKMRNLLKEITGFDIQNDAYLNVCGNYCATNYDCNEYEKENILEAIRNIPHNQKELLLKEERLIRFLKDELELNLENFF